MVLRPATATCLGLLAAGLAARAEAADAVWSAQAGASSAYMSKGVSKTGDRPQVWGRLERAEAGTYAGVWASNLDIPQKADAEIQAYAGRRAEALGFALDVSAFYKVFPGVRADLDRDLVEFRADAAHALGPVTARLRAEWTPDNFGAARQASWVEGRLTWASLTATEFSAAVGRRDQAGGADYLAWNLGVRFPLTSRLGADLRWYDTDRHALGRSYRGRVNAGLTVGF